MTIKRNDACPCGSGRKYKKCCLMKESLADLQQVKADQFFELKYKLTTRMLGFLREQLTGQEIREATRLFQAIQKHETSSKVADSKNKFWLCYFYTFSHGLRGVEWFLEKGGRFSTAEQDMLSIWVKMRPRLLQLTGEETSGLTVTDLITEEVFFLPYCESLQKGYPWGVVIAMLEPFGDAYCIHGISSFKKPSLAAGLSNLVQQKIRESGKAYPEVMLDSFLELVEYTMSPVVQHAQGDSTIEQDTTLIYEVFDFHQAIRFIQEQIHGISADDWDDSRAQFSWTDSWYEYTDSSYPGRVQVSELLASIDLNKEELKLSTRYPEKAIEFVKKADQFPEVLKLKEKKNNAIPSSPGTKVTTLSVRVDREDTPPWLSVYAQQLKILSKGLDRQSPLDLGANEEKEALETQLREAEYRLAVLISQKYGRDVVPFNPNPIRSQWGLPVSPFVSSERSCSLIPIELDLPKIQLIPKEDMPYYKQVGLTQKTAFAFYAEDLVQFFKEKTLGKSSATVKKYEWGIQKMVNYFGYLDELPLTWNDCFSSLWENLLAGFYLFDSPAGNLSQAQSFFSVTKNLAQWLDQKHETTHFYQVKSMVYDMEEDVLHCVRWLKSYRPLNKQEADSCLHKLEGDFEILNVSHNRVQVRLINHDLFLTVSGLETEYLQQGMVLQATIGQKTLEIWEMIDVKVIYPPQARRFLNITEKSKPMEAITI